MFLKQRFEHKRINIYCYSRKCLNYAVSASSSSSAVAAVVVVVLFPDEETPDLSYIQLHSKYCTKKERRKKQTIKLYSTQFHSEIITRSLNLIQLLKAVSVQ